MPAMNTTSSGSQAKAINITKGALVVMLLYALNDDNSYGYYQLLRWASFGAFGYLVYDSIVRKELGWAWAFAMLALLYNPFAKVALGRGIWEVVNLITAAMLTYSFFRTRRSSQPSDAARP
jgi:hypothetical protein